MFCVSNTWVRHGNQTGQMYHIYRSPESAPLITNLSVRSYFGKYGDHDYLTQLLTDFGQLYI